MTSLSKLALVLGAALAGSLLPVTPANACGWRPFTPISPAATLPYGGEVTSIVRRPGQIDLFASGNDGKVYTASWNDATSPAGPNWYSRMAWSPISPANTSRPGQVVSAISRRPGHIDLFVVGHDGKIYTRAWDENAPNDSWYAANAWSAISTAGTAGSARVTAISRRPEQIDLFVVGIDGKIYTQWWNDLVPSHNWYDQGPWSAISTEGTATLRTTVAAVSRRPEQIDLFVVGNDGKVYTRAWNDFQPAANSWYDQSAWFAISPKDATYGYASVTAISRRPEQIDLFVIGQDGAVYTRWWNDADTGTNWYDQAGWPRISPVGMRGVAVKALSRRPEQIDLYSVRRDGTVVTQWWNDDDHRTWFDAHDWIPVGAPFPGHVTVSAIARGPSQIDLFGTGADGTVLTTTWIDQQSFFPHYRVATLLYAPPGNDSEVSYTTGSSTGTRVEVVESQSSGTDAKVETTGTEFEDKWVSGTKDGKSHEFHKATTSTLSVKSSKDAIAHDDDVFFLWTNSQVDMCATGMKWSTASGSAVDIVSVTVAELQGKIPMPEWKAAALANLTPGEIRSILALDPWAGLAPGQSPTLDPKRFAFDPKQDVLRVDGPDYVGGPSVGTGESIGYDQSAGTIHGDISGHELVAIFGGEVVFGFRFSAKAGIDFVYQYENVTENVQGRQQLASALLRSSTVGFHSKADVWYDAVFGSYAFTPHAGAQPMPLNDLPPIVDTSAF